MIEIRPYRDDDRAATASLWMASWRSTGLAVAREPAEAELYRLGYERIARELAAGWVVHLAWYYGKLVGFLALKPEAGCLDQIFVLPQAQGQGIGRALLDFAKERLPSGIWLRTAAAIPEPVASMSATVSRRARARGIPFSGTRQLFIAGPSCRLHNY